MTTIINNISNKTYHYFYKITNRINGMFYYGIHSTNNLDDGYMGSGKRIKAAIKKYGVKNFDKEIIRYFNSLKELSDYEQQIVNEDLLKNEKCYNLIKGGYFLEGDSLKKLKRTFKEKNHQQGKNNSQYGKCWITKDNNSITIFKKDLQKYLDDGWIRGRIIVNKEKISKTNKTRKFVWVWKDNNVLQISEIDLQKYLDDGWIRGRKQPKVKILKEKLNYIKVKDHNNNIFIVDTTDPRYLSGELIPFSRGKIMVKDNDENKFYVDTTDPRYLSGELIPIRSYDSKILIRDNFGKYYQVTKDDPRLNDSTYVYSTKGLKYTDEQRQKIKNAKTKYKMTWVNNGVEHKYIRLDELEIFLKENTEWTAGRIKKS